MISMEPYRKTGGALDLTKMWYANAPEDLTGDQMEQGARYCERVDRHRPIVSRQAAAIVIATAEYLVRQDSG